MWVTTVKGEGYWNGEQEDSFYLLLCLSSGLIQQDHMSYSAFATKKCGNFLL